MKRLKAILTGALIAFSCIPFNSYAKETAPAIWDGTVDTDWYVPMAENEPVKEYHITTAEQLAGLAAIINAGGVSGKEIFYLDSDIYLNDVSDFDKWDTKPPANEWVSIGSNNEFMGKFYGNDHTIYGLYQNFDSNDSNETVTAGLFGFVYASEVIGVNVENGYLKCSGLNNVNVGGIAGEAYALNILGNHIKHCSFNGKIITDNNFNVCSGGIVGHAKNFSITRCRNYGELYDSDNAFDTYFGTGGIVGYADVIYCIECINNGNIIGSNTNKSVNRKRFGGIVGTCDFFGIEMQSCVNTGDLLIDAPYKIDPENDDEILELICGGIIGWGDNNYSIDNCYNIGKIKEYKELCENTHMYVGGLSGSFFSDAINGSFALSGTCSSIYLSETEDISCFRSEKEMKSPEFAELLGDKYIYTEGDFPQLKWTVQGTGDVNLDDEVSVSDLVLLMQYLINKENTLKYWREADIFKDNKIDTFDLVLLRQLLIKNK